MTTKSERTMRGVELEVDDQMYWFTPFRAGPTDVAKRKAMYALLEASEGHIASAGQDVAAFGASYETVCAAIVEFGRQLLVDNYGAQALEIAERLGPYHAPALLSIAREGKLPRDFTTDAKVSDG